MNKTAPGKQTGKTADQVQALLALYALIFTPLPGFVRHSGYVRVWVTGLASQLKKTDSPAPLKRGLKALESKCAGSFITPFARQKEGETTARTSVLILPPLKRVAL